MERNEWEVGEEREGGPQKDGVRGRGERADGPFDSAADSD